MAVKFNQDVAETHPKGVAAIAFAALINKEMDGKACMDILANSTLYDDNKVKEAMLLGDVHLVAPSPSKFEAFTKICRPFDLLFLLAELEPVQRFFDSEAARTPLRTIDEVGFTGLSHEAEDLVAENRSVLEE